MDKIDEISRKRKEAHTRLLSLGSRYGVDGVVLGCMKLPVLFARATSRANIVDTLDRHTSDILDYIYAPEEAPTK